jgi:hypothetical protein
LIALVGSERLGALLRKEKDEAGPPDCFRRNSSNAFIPRFAELKAFLFLSPSPSSSQSQSRTRTKDENEDDSLPRWSLNQNPFREFVFAGQN